MRRVLIGLGNPLGHFLASQRIYADCLAYKQALNGVPRCDEAVIVMPASKRPGGNGLGRHGSALIAALHPAKRIVLLSSIGVYPSKGLPFDETAACGFTGRSWLASFEQELLRCGTPSQVLRLPDIFGPYFGKCCGLGADASQINRVAIHQMYPARRLESDIEAARDVGTLAVNLVPEPLPMARVLAEIYPGQIGQVVTPAPYSRIRTRYAASFGGSGGYIMTAGEVLAEISRHVRELQGMPHGPKSATSLREGRAHAGAAA